MMKTSSGPPTKVVMRKNTEGGENERRKRSPVNLIVDDPKKSEESTRKGSTVAVVTLPPRRKMPDPRETTRDDVDGIVPIAQAKSPRHYRGPRRKVEGIGIIAAATIRPAHKTLRNGSRTPKKTKSIQLLGTLKHRKKLRRILRLSQAKE